MRDLTLPAYPERSVVQIILLIASIEQIKKSPYLWQYDFHGVYISQLCITNFQATHLKGNSPSANLKKLQGKHISKTQKIHLEKSQ